MKSLDKAAQLAMLPDCPIHTVDLTVILLSPPRLPFEADALRALRPWLEALSEGLIERGALAVAAVAAVQARAVRLLLGAARRDEMTWRT
jgi:hypothetical protein